MEHRRSEHTSQFTFVDASNSNESIASSALKLDFVFAVKLGDGTNSCCYCRSSNAY